MICSTFNIFINFNILGLTGGKRIWQNPRWRPFQINKMPSTPSPNEYLSFELIFHPCFSLDNTFNERVHCRKYYTKFRPVSTASTQSLFDFSDHGLENRKIREISTFPAHVNEKKIFLLLQFWSALSFGLVCVHLTSITQTWIWRTFSLLLCSSLKIKF